MPPGRLPIIAKQKNKKKKRAENTIESEHLERARKKKPMMEQACVWFVVVAYKKRLQDCKASFSYIIIKKIMNSSHSLFFFCLNPPKCRRLRFTEGHGCPTPQDIKHGTKKKHQTRLYRTNKEVAVYTKYFFCRVLSTTEN